jgi:hypothetical protein
MNRHAIIKVCWKQGVSVWPMTRSYPEDNWDDHVSFIQESVKRRLEHGKLKNFQC